MCDYSSRFRQFRPAKPGDRLIAVKTHRVCGFADLHDPQIAICLKSGTELAFDEPYVTASLFGRWFSRWRNQNKPRSLALFRQISKYGRRQDILEFPDGHRERLCALYPGDIRVYRKSFVHSLPYRKNKQATLVKKASSP